MAAARLICADGELARLDGELGVAFQKRKAEISAPDQSKFVADQLAWIRDRNTRCDLYGKNSAAIDLLGSFKPCMANAIRERIAFLAQTDSMAAQAAPPLPMALSPTGNAQSSEWTDPNAAPGIVRAGPALAQSSTSQQPTTAPAAPEPQKPVNPFDAINPDRGGKILGEPPTENPLDQAAGGMPAVIAPAPAVPSLGAPAPTPGPGRSRADFEKLFPRWIDEAYAAMERHDYAKALKLITPLATKGDALAQIMLGRMCAGGHGVPQDYAEAAKWFRLAADQGNADAETLLAGAYFSGHGVPQNYTEAMKWFRLSASQGNAEAQTYLGASYYLGQGVPQNDAEAVKWYRLAAEHGNANGQWLLGSMYEVGRGVAQNDAEAVKWYRLAAKQGNAIGQWSLGATYADGRGVLQDYAEAVKWYRLAAEQGLARAQASLGRMYFNGRGVAQDYAEAVKWFRLAANQDSADAQSLLGVMYQMGWGAPQNEAEAVKWYRLAANQGDAVAQNQLGHMYIIGHGVPQNYTEAMKWFRLSASRGNAEAQTHLGAMYHLGQGVPQNDAEAAKWFRLAADQGNADAQWLLGIMYYTGHGTREDYVQAHMWFNLSAAQGFENARKSLDSLEELMTPAQIAEAQRLAREWRPKTANASASQTAPRSPTPEKPESDATAGTAFFVSEEGTALTNSHVVERCRQIRVHSGAQNGTARVVARDGENDLALVATDLHPTSTANWRLSIKQGEDIIVFGFPLAGVLATSGNVTVGNVTALAGLGNDSRFLQISAPVQPGNSGGPLLDRRGNVVGIVVAQLDALKIASTSGDIPQNINFAIKASVAEAFLDAQGVAHPEGANIPALSTPDLAERAKALTMQVVCAR